MSVGVSSCRFIRHVRHAGPGHEVEAGRITFHGSARLIQSFPGWFVVVPMLDEVRSRARAERDAIGLASPSSP